MMKHNIWIKWNSSPHRTSQNLFIYLHVLGLQNPSYLGPFASPGSPSVFQQFLAFAYPSAFLDPELLGVIYLEVVSYHSTAWKEGLSLLLKPNPPHPDT